MAKITVDVPPREIESACIEAPFDEGKKALEKADYKIISLQENARLRMQEGSKSDVSQYGNWVRAGVIYVPNQGKFLTKNSPIMANAKNATDCHRNGKEFYLTAEQVEQALGDSVALSVNSIPTNRFGDCDITGYAFGEDAKKYGEFLKEFGIDSMPIWTVEVKDKAFARQVWFYGLDGDGSALGGKWGLDWNGRVRGVRGSAEGAAPKISEVESYNFNDIQRVLKANGLTGIEKILIDGLRQ